MTTRTDDELFDAFRQDGDSAALAELFDRTANEVLRIAVHLAGNIGDAEDLVQDTFLGAIEAASRYRADGRFRGWLIGILQNRAKRLRRWRRRSPQTEDAVDLEVGSGEAAAVAAERGEVRDRVRAAIDRFTEPYRTVLALHLRHGFSVEEIATSLGRSQHTVRSQLSRGRERLEKRLPAEWATAGVAGVSTAGLGRVREIVLAKAAGGEVAATAVAAGLAGVGAVKAKFGLAAALLVVLGTSIAIGLTGNGDESAPRSGESATVATTAMTDGDEDHGPTDSPEPTTTRVAIEGADDADSEFASVRVRVIDGRTDRPVPGATVSFLRPGFRSVDLPRPEYHESFYLAQHDLIEYHRQYGESVVADDEGWATIPANVRFYGLAAYVGERFGVRFDMDAEEIRIAPDRSLRVVVTDHAGRPAKGLVFWLGYDPDKPLMGMRQRSASLLARTDAEGVATFRHVHTLVAKLRAIGHDTVHLLAPRWNQRRSFALDALPTDGDVRFRLPAAGRVVVHVTDATGAPVRTHEPEYFDVEIRAAGLRRSLRESIGTDGAARFVDVPLGVALRAETSALASWAEVEFAGPRTPDELVEITLQLGVDAISYVGRAVDTRGDALRSRELLLHVDGNARRLDTDAAGRFVFYDEALEDDDETDVRTAVLQVASVKRFRNGDEEWARGTNARARVVLDGRRAGSVIDLGDLVMHGAPRVAAGRLRVNVEDQLTQLKERLRLRVERPTESGWRELDDVVIQWSEDGAFELFGGADPGAPLRLVGTTGGFGGYGGDEHLPFRPLEFPATTANLDLDVTIGGSIAIDEFEGERRSPLRFDLEPLDGQWPDHDDRKTVGLAANSWSTRRDPEGSVVAHLIGRLWPGRYRLTVRAIGLAEPLRTVDAVEILPGTRVAPLRADPIDLRSLQQAELRLVTADRRSPSDRRLWLRDARTQRVTEVDLRSSQLVVKPGITAVTRADGWRLETWAPHQKEIALRRAIQVDFTLETTRSDPLHVELSYADGQQLSAWREVEGCRLVGVRSYAREGVHRAFCVSAGQWHVRVFATRDAKPRLVLEDSIVIEEHETRTARTLTIR